MDNLRVQKITIIGRCVLCERTERIAMMTVGVIVTHSPYAPITFVNALLFPDVYFVFFNNCVFIIVSSVAVVLGIHNICVCHLLFMLWLLTSQNGLNAPDSNNLLFI